MSASRFWIKAAASILLWGVSMMMGIFILGQCVSGLEDLFLNGSIISILLPVALSLYFIGSSLLVWCQNELGLPRTASRKPSRRLFIEILGFYLLFEVMLDFWLDFLLYLIFFGEWLFFVFYILKIRNLAQISHVSYTPSVRPIAWKAVATHIVAQLGAFICLIRWEENYFTLLIAFFVVIAAISSTHIFPRQTLSPSNNLETKSQRKEKFQNCWSSIFLNVAIFLIAINFGNEVGARTYIRFSFGSNYTVYRAIDPSWVLLWGLVAIGLWMARVWLFRREFQIHTNSFSVCISEEIGSNLPQITKSGQNIPSRGDSSQDLKLPNKNLRQVVFIASLFWGIYALIINTICIYLPENRAGAFIDIWIIFVFQWLLPAIGLIASFFALIGWVERKALLPPQIHGWLKWGTIGILGMMPIIFYCYLTNYPYLESFWPCFGVYVVLWAINLAVLKRGFLLQNQLAVQKKFGQVQAPWRNVKASFPWIYYVVILFGFLSLGLGLAGNGIFLIVLGSICILCGLTLSNYHRSFEPGIRMWVRGNADIVLCGAMMFLFFYFITRFYIMGSYPWFFFHNDFNVFCTAYLGFSGGTLILRLENRRIVIESAPERPLPSIASPSMDQKVQTMPLFGEESNPSGSSIPSNPSDLMHCPHCGSILEKGFFDVVVENVILFCPHCGQRIFRNDIRPYSKSELINEHQRVLTHFTSPD